MVAGKVKLSMGFQKSPAHHSKSKLDTPPPPPKPPSPSPASAKITSQKSTAFSRSFGVYFPRSSAQVQPKPPDVSELLRLVEDLRDRESRLKTELLEHKLLRETVAIVPVLESEIDAARIRIAALEAENARLRAGKDRAEEEARETECRAKKMEAEIAELLKNNNNNNNNNSNNQSADEFSSSSQRFHGLMELSGKSNLIRTLRQRSFRANSSSSFTASDEIVITQNHPQKLEDSKRFHDEVSLTSDRPRHSRSISDELLTESTSSSESVLTNVRSREPRVPKPPPVPSSALLPSSTPSPPPEQAIAFAPPPPPPMKTAAAPPPPPPPPKMKAAPPPPPPPPKGRKAVEKVRRVPEVVEFYHSLMRRDSRREASLADAPATANARDMIGEIENRSTHLLAIKTDVETQGDFIRFLIKEVENAAFTNIDDVVPFVKWLDDELSYLVDERAVLKHFEWPEKKADALREAAFGYCDLKKLEAEASSFRDEARHLCGPALKKMQALFEKLEHGVYNLSRMKESGTKKYKNFQIPTDWMLDSGLVSQIKLASVKLALKYMKRVSAELEMVGGGPEEEELIVQGVKFAFRAHQFAGGFDVETMRAFEELRDKARSCHNQSKLLCRSTSTPC